MTCVIVIDESSVAHGALFSPLTRIYYQSCGEIYGKVCVCILSQFFFFFFFGWFSSLNWVLKKETREMLPVVVYKESFSVGDALWVDLLYVFFFFFVREFQPMASASNNNSLSSDQDTNHLFGVDRDWIPNLLFNYQRFYQSS